MAEYRPVRIIKLVEMHHASGTALKAAYPHAIIQKAGKTFKAFYKPGSVVDAPTESERKLFNTVKGSFAEIPQLPRIGLDDPASGVARSRKGAHKGEMNFKREINSMGNSPDPINKAEKPEVNKNE